MGVVTSSSQFFRQIGSTMGVALFGTALTGFLRSELGRVMPGADLNTLRQMSAAAKASGVVLLPLNVREAIAAAITHTFTLGLLILVLAFVIVLVMPRIQAPSKDG